MSKSILKNAVFVFAINGLFTNIVVADQLQAGPELATVSEKITSVPKSQQTSQTEQGLVKHKALEEIKAGERMQIKSKINAKDGVKLARVYFKSAGAANYNFVVLNNDGAPNIYSAELPAAGNATKSIEYKIVFQNAYGEIYKTKKYQVSVTQVMTLLPRNAESGFIYVYSELPEDETSSEGFNDNMRYAYDVTKISTQAGTSLSAANSGTGFIGSSGGSVGAVSVSTATASTATASTAAITTGSTTIGGVSMGTVLAVGGGVAGVAVAAVVIGGDDDDSDSNSCFSGIIEHTVTESGVTVTQWTEIRDGVPFGYSASNSVNGCLDDVSGISTQFDAADKAEYEELCLSKEAFEAVFTDSGASFRFVSDHGCASIFQF